MAQTFSTFVGNLTSFDQPFLQSKRDLTAVLKCGVPLLDADGEGRGKRATSKTQMFSFPKDFTSDAIDKLGTFSFGCK